MIMLKNFVVFHFLGDKAKKSEDQIFCDYFKDSELSTGAPLIIKTCQRLLVIYFSATSYLSRSHYQKLTSLLPSEEIEYVEGHNAYHLLLEILCGLKSKIVAENEISHQFKLAYQNYLGQEAKYRHPHLLEIIEKIFKDAKQIRTQYLKEIGQQSYAGIARKIVQSHSALKENQQLLLFGSGALAQEIILQFYKKYQITLCARNEQKVEQLKSKWPLLKFLSFYHFDREEKQILPKDYYAFPIIINTIGIEKLLFTQNFFKKWEDYHPTHSRVFIDLGQPSVIQTGQEKGDGIYYLKDIFEKSALLDQNKKEKIEHAKNRVFELSEKRAQSFTLSMPFTWNELQTVFY